MKLRMIRQLSLLSVAFAISCSLSPSPDLPLVTPGGDGAPGFGTGGSSAATGGTTGGDGDAYGGSGTGTGGAPSGGAPPSGGFGGVSPSGGFGGASLGGADSTPGDSNLAGADSQEQQ